MYKVKHRYIKPLMFFLLAAVLLLSGCGDSSRISDSPGQPTEDSTGSAVQQEYPSDPMTYRLSEQLIEEPYDIFLENDAKEGQFLLVCDYLSTGGRLYCLYEICREGEQYNICEGYYLCVLEAPYDRWSCYVLPYDCWPAEEGFEYRVEGISGVTQDGVYLSLAWADHGAWEYQQLCHGFYGWDGRCQVLHQLTADPFSLPLTLYPIDDVLYTFSHTSGNLRAFDKDLQPILLQNTEEQLKGCLTDRGENLWYGLDSKSNLAVWDKPGGEKLFTLKEGVSRFGEFLLARSADGSFVLADTNGIWTGDGETLLEKALSFQERDYILEEILGINVNEDNSLTLFVRFDGDFYRLTGEPCLTSELPQRQEITVVSGDTYGLEAVAVAFNRKNPQYHVTIASYFEWGGFPDYRRNLQLEISAGKGPDILLEYALDIAGCIEKGYLEPLDDVIEEPADYWPAALETGTSGGRLYGIPYNVSLSLMAVSESLAGELDAWSLEQMMDTVRNSPAEALTQGWKGSYILQQYGLYSLDHNQFIDYDEGISHLSEQPFLDFLAFARDYGDDLYYADSSCSEAGSYYQEGKIAALHLNVFSPGELLWAESCFQGKAVMIGLPSPQGEPRDIAMNAERLYLNSASQYKEGAKEFLRFLISEEGQSLLAECRHNSFLSCRKDVTETILRSFGPVSSLFPEMEMRSSHGITYMPAVLEEEQIDLLLSLMEESRAGFDLPYTLLVIFDEEIAPYFAGDCTAEEAAAKLHNRVQLYFDEKK